MRALIDEALIRWQAADIPRPPMSAMAALQFAYDWPTLLPWMPARCCTCGRPVDDNYLQDHLDKDHPGWLDAWNARLRDAGIVIAALLS